MAHLRHDELAQPVFVVLPWSSRLLMTRQHLCDATGVRSSHKKGATCLSPAHNCREIVSYQSVRAARAAVAPPAYARMHAGTGAALVR